MEITIHKSVDKLDRYFKWLHELYNTEIGYEFFIADKKKAVEFCSRNNYPISFIEIVVNNNLIAHAALIQNSQLPTSEAFFGFFECIDDKEVFLILWDNLVSIAKENNKKKILGPIDGAIWFQYRVNSLFTAETRFSSEPISQKHYPELLKSVNPDDEILYHSAYRKKFDAIVKITEASYYQAINKGFEIKLAEYLDEKVLKDIYDLSISLFNKNWGYTPISYLDFLSLYDTKKFSDYISSIYTVTKNNKLIGYCVNMLINDTMIIKTIGVSNEYQGMGIGNALVYKVHSDAINSGNISKIIYALIKKENQVKHFPTDDIQIFREYSSFEYSI
jgi:predicted GNAT family acetyltransferase